MQKFNFNKITSGLIVTFLLVTIVSFTGQVNAQAPPDMSNIPGAPKMITGPYSNSDYGVQMTFPDGWQAMETKSSTITAVSAFQQSQESNTSGSNSATLISLTMMPKPTTTYADPNIPTDPKYKCDTLSSDNTNVNGMSAVVIVVHCTSPDGDMKLKGYSFHTDKNLIGVNYMAMPASLFDSNVATFDSAVQTLQIANTVGAPSSSPTATQNPTSDATVPEFPTIASLILAVSIFTITGFTMISRKSGLFLFGRN
jgi:predicted secreted protein with PEFG-CTERM motif